MFIIKESMIRMEKMEKINNIANTPISISEIAKRIIEYTGASDQEIVIAVPLSTKLHAGYPIVIGIGGMDSSIIDLRILFRSLLAAGAARFVITHNHPDGSTTPSSEDIAITKRIKEAGKIIGIDLLDHIIVTDKEYFSFHNEGLLK
jgi:DNA repair protein RadC